MLGYLGHPESTAETIRDGVLYTGDIGYLDARGGCSCETGRNALILRGGANVYPAEVERVLLEAPGVRGASVVGVPDERLGQRVAAAVEAEEGCTLDIDDLVEPLRGAVGALQGARLWRIGTLPRNAMGKVVRTELESWFAEAVDDALLDQRRSVDSVLP